MGGQITAKYVGFGTYEVTATLYRDMAGISMQTMLFIQFEGTGANAGQTWTENAPLVSNSLFSPGVEEYIYTVNTTVPSFGTFNIYYWECCRNSAIINMTPGVAFVLDDVLFADSTNSTPVFLNPPIPMAQLGVPFYYNPLPYDADGDSLAWVLDTPLMQTDTPDLLRTSFL